MIKPFIECSVNLKKLLFQFFLYDGFTVASYPGLGPIDSVNINLHSKKVSLATRLVFLASRNSTSFICYNLLHVMYMIHLYLCTYNFPPQAVLHSRLGDRYRGWDHNQTGVSSID